MSSAGSLGYPSAPDFPTYLGSIARTDNASIAGEIINSSNVATLHRLWHFQAAGSIATQPVEANGTVYFGAWDGYEYALYANNGTVRWKTFLGQVSGGGVSVCGNYTLGVSSTATVANGTVYVNGGTPALFALNASTGQIEWNTSLGGPGSAGYYLWSSPLVDSNVVFDAISSQCDDPLVPAGLAAISLSSHQVVAYFNASAPNPNGSSIWSTPALNATSGAIFVTTGNPYRRTPSTYAESIVALNASNLSVIDSWQVPSGQAVPDSDFGGTPVLVDVPGSPAMVLAVNKNGRLYDWYQSNLTLRWSDPISNQTSIATPAYGGGLVYVYAPTTSIGGVAYNSSIRAIDPVTGNYVWQLGLSKHYLGYAAPLWYDGMLVVSANSQLLVLNASTGTVLKAFAWALNGFMMAGPAIARDELFFTAGSTLTALDLPLAASFRSAASASPPTVSLNASVRGGLPPYQYHWDFGDGSQSTASSPTHVYGAIGAYRVRLNVTDAAGNLSAVQAVVHVGWAYPVAFAETGLPLGSTWALVVANRTVAGSGTLRASLPNGTYAYTVQSVANYSAPSTRSFTVNGSGITLTTRFTLVRYVFTLREVGLPSATLWGASVAGLRGNTTGTFLNFRLPNGTYTYTVGNVSNYSRTPSGVVVIQGQSMTVAVRFALVKYSITFTESGLPSGAKWNVTLGGLALARTSSVATIIFALANGTYSYRSATGVRGVDPHFGNVSVGGSALTVLVNFSSESELGESGRLPAAAFSFGGAKGTAASTPLLAARSRES